MIVLLVVRILASRISVITSESALRGLENIRTCRSSSRNFGIWSTLCFIFWLDQGCCNIVFMGTITVSCLITLQTLKYISRLERHIGIANRWHYDRRLVTAYWKRMNRLRAPDGSPESLVRIRGSRRLTSVERAVFVPVSPVAEPTS